MHGEKFRRDESMAILRFLFRDGGGGLQRAYHAPPAGFAPVHKHQCLTRRVLSTSAEARPLQMDYLRLRSTTLTLNDLSWAVDLRHYVIFMVHCRSSCEEDVFYTTYMGRAGRVSLRSIRILHVGQVRREYVVNRV